MRNTMETRIFKTIGSDEILKAHDMQPCVIVRPLTSREADLFETGPMYRIRFSDGFETDAFSDELFKGDKRCRKHS